MHRRTTHDGNLTVRLRLGRIARAIGAFALVALVVFHGRLLIERMQDRSILEPAVALQWGATVALLGLLAYLRRRAVPIFRGRTALAFWLLVLLLHLVPGAPSSLLDWEPTHLILALPASWSVAFALLLTTLGLLSGARLPRPQSVTGRRRLHRGPPAFDLEARPRLYARPPPPATIG